MPFSHLGQENDEIGDFIGSSTSIDDDGRVSINIRPRGRLRSLFRSESKHSLVDSMPLLEEGNSEAESLVECPQPPPLNIVIQIVGSRGDVQPFIALGLTLKNNYGHRVRIATHYTFRNFVYESGLEFFNIGGNPEELMAFMVRNPGLLPSYQALVTGDVKLQRKNIHQILQGCWRSCIEPGDGSGVHYGDAKPFIADAIIANPPSFAHIHCAEKLGVPLHLMFTMPYSPTGEFPHPLANIRGSDLDKRMTNLLSYTLIERLIWHGIGDLINKFRQSTLNLEPYNLMWASGMIRRLKIPCTYCWSPTVLPKPKDWASHLSVSGYYFLPTPLTSSFAPSPALIKFLETGDTPIYVGFGSIVVDNPAALTDMVFEAVQKARVRAIVAKGWGGLGTKEIDLPDNIFFLDPVPHSWLFERVSAVVHHGGAGTTAAGLAAGKPTVIVPFFGDQRFWGEIVAKAGAGPQPIPFEKLTADQLADQVQMALRPDIKRQARYIQLKLANEDGCEKGSRIFHRFLDIDDKRCAILPERLAVWELPNLQIKLSSLTAAILIEHQLLQRSDLRLYRQRDYVIEDHPIDPISGGALAFLGSFGDIMYEIVDIPRKVAKIVTKDKPLSSSDNTVAEANTSPRDRERLESQNCAMKTPTKAVASPRHSYGDGEKSNEESSKVVDVAITIGEGFGRLSKAGLLSPLYFTMGIARGFQSIPIAYGDTTVRKPEKVTGLISGIEVGSKQFGYGFYDGITGVVTQPIRGAQQNGLPGLISGIGRGIGGLILKPGAAIFGLPAYALQGLSQEVQKLFVKDFEGHVGISRLIEGHEQMQLCSADEQREIIDTWMSIRSERQQMLANGLYDPQSQ